MKPASERLVCGKLSRDDHGRSPGSLRKNDEWKTRAKRGADQRYGCWKFSITLRKSGSSSIIFPIFSTECITVEWCLSLKSRPISGYESAVSFRQRNIATWRGKAIGFAFVFALRSETRSP